MRTDTPERNASPEKDGLNSRLTHSQDGVVHTCLPFFLPRGSIYSTPAYSLWIKRV